MVLLSEAQYLLGYPLPYFTYFSSCCTVKEQNTCGRPRHSSLSCGYERADLAGVTAAFCQSTHINAWFWIQCS